MLWGSAPVMVTSDLALPGRPEALVVPPTHAVLGTPMRGPWPEGTEVVYLALGCFWGAEKVFWQIPGVVTTAVGYQGGFTPNPTYDEVCTGRTGHAETVLVAYDPSRVEARSLLATFWESHDPTQGFRQGNDRGTQYRSAVFWTTTEQRDAAVSTSQDYARALDGAGFGPVTTQILSAEDAGPFFYAEGYHQQYLHTNPDGYCPDHGTGVACPVARSPRP